MAASIEWCEREVSGVIGNLAAAAYPGVIATLLLSGAWSAYADVREHVAAGHPLARRRAPTVAGCSFLVLGAYYSCLVVLCVVGRG